MKYLGFCLAFCALLLSGCLQEEAAPGEVPTSFYYKDKPIDPACLTGSGTTTLSACTGTMSGEIGYTPEQYYGIQIADQGNAYIYYKHVGQYKGRDYVRLIYALGGTGQYMMLRSVDHGRSRIEVADYAGGEGCNGGVVNASADKDGVHYARNITPFTLVALATKGREAYQPSRNLPDCNDCCIGTVQMEGFDVSAVKLNSKPLPADANDVVGSCFADVYRSAYTQFGGVLTRDKLAKFGDMFIQQCGDLR